MIVLIPCVNYDDFLTVTLPHWLAMLREDDKVVVVTNFSDEATIATCEDQNDPRVVFYRTNAWKADGGVFNKAAALDEALGWSATPGDVVLSCDADALPRGRRPGEALVQDDVIYGCHRYDIPNPQYLARVLSGRLQRSRLRRMITWGGRAMRSHHKSTPQVLNGYFQLFRYAPEKRSFGSYPAANEYDVQFGFQFPKGVCLEDPYMLHLGENHINWAGRVAPRWNET